MAKCKIFYANETKRLELDSKVEHFLDELETNGHTFISMNAISYGKNQNYIDEFRTEIIYIQNPTRKVIVEKTGAQNGNQ